MSETKQVSENSITSGVIWKQLLIFFFPILIGTFFQQLYNTVDTIVVGQYVGTNALAAVGTTGTLINLLVGFFVGVSSGATVIISQFFGAGDGKNVSKAVHTSMALALVGGLFIMVFGLLTSRPSLELLGVPEEIMDDALTYLNVYYAGIIASMIYNVGTGAPGHRGQPDAVLIVCCLVNIVLDLLFVLAFHWDVFGVAFATVLSQVVSAVLIMLWGVLPGGAAGSTGAVIRIGLPAGLQSVLYSISNLVVQAWLASWSARSTALSGCAFGIAITTFVGQVQAEHQGLPGDGPGHHHRMVLRFFTGDEAVRLGAGLLRAHRLPARGAGEIMGPDLFKRVLRRHHRTGHDPRWSARC